MAPTEAADQAYRLFMPILGQLLAARQALIDRSGQIGGRISAGLIARDLGLKLWWQPWDAGAAIRAVPQRAA